MEWKRTLYRIEVEGNLKEFYVVADSFDRACSMVSQYLDSRNYGYRFERQIKSVEIIAPLEKGCMGISKVLLI